MHNLSLYCNRNNNKDSVSIQLNQMDFTETGVYHCVGEKKMEKRFCDSRGSCTKADKLPQVMSLESVSVGAEGNEKKSGVWS